MTALEAFETAELAAAGGDASEQAAIDRSLGRLNTLQEQAV